jgi:hypothetical protein
MLVSTVVGVSLGEVVLAGTMWLRNSDRPMPLLVVVFPRSSV